jgi:tetratricopeptide (TPR) repeat protein
MTMNGKCLVALAMAAGAFGQTPEPQPFPKPDLQQMESQVDALSKQAEDLARLATKIRIDPFEIDVNPYLAGIDKHLALMQRHVRSDDADREYDAGTRALDSRHYDEAVSRFDRVVENKGPRADGALYWRAYALNRLGRRNDALASLATLRQQYPNSSWVKDGQALEVEVRQSNGKPPAPSQEANDDLKLMAINGLMNADPERAIPLLDGLLKGPASPQLKDRAMFVLTQNKSPQAHVVLIQFAKGGAGNPDLQERAVRYIGMTNTPESRQELAGIYASSNDVNVKRAILRSLMSPAASDTLFEIAKSEKNPELRRVALRQLAFAGNSAQAAQLYASEQSPENKDEIINGLFAHGDAKTMVELARKETDPERKKFIVSRLANMHNKEATDYLMELLK